MVETCSMIWIISYFLTNKTCGNKIPTTFLTEYKHNEMENIKLIIGNANPSVYSVVIYWVRNINGQIWDWKVLKCGVGGGWRRSVGQTVWATKKVYIKSRRRGISYDPQREGRLTGFVTSSKTLCWRKNRRTEVKGTRGRRRKQLLDDHKEKKRSLESESGSIRSHSVENWLWKRKWTCLATDYKMNEDGIMWNRWK